MQFASLVLAYYVNHYNSQRKRTKNARNVHNSQKVLPLKYKFFLETCLMASAEFHLLMVQLCDLLQKSLKLYTFPFFFPFSKPRDSGGSGLPAQIDFKP